MSQNQPSTRLSISERALVQRINRRLDKDGERLKATRGERSAAALGRYYIVDVYRNVISNYKIDIEDVGRDLGVLQPYEQLIEGSSGEVK